MSWEEELQYMYEDRSCMLLAIWIAIQKNKKSTHSHLFGKNSSDSIYHGQKSFEPSNQLVLHLVPAVNNKVGKKKQFDFWFSILFTNTVLTVYQFITVIKKIPTRLTKNWIAMQILIISEIFAPSPRKKERKNVWNILPINRAHKCIWN